MKIAFVVGVFPKLSETFVLDQITGLIDLGHDVHVFALEAPVETVHHPDVARYALADKTVVLDRPRTNVVRGALRSLADFPSWIGGVTHRDALATRFARGPQGPFDVIYCHFGHVAEKARRLRRAGFFSGPLVAVFHAYDLTVIPRTHGRRFYAPLFTEASRLLPITERWRAELVKLGADPGKIAVHRLGIDLATFVFRERTLTAGEPLRLVSVGRFVEKKGFAVAIDALARVQKRLERPVEYHLVGDGPLRAELTRRVEERGLRKEVVFHGALDRHGVTSLFETMHVLLVPSVTGFDGDSEGLPMVLMEGMASGLPVVATDHSGIPELVEDGVNGRLVPERDATALAEAVVDLAAHPERWPDLTRAARRAVERDHELSRSVGELDALFRSLLDTAR